VLPVLGVGVAGGLVGAAYLALLHLLQRWLWPEHNGIPVQACILVAAGVVVAVGVRVLGPTGDVELLVDNIHVLGGAEQPRQTRSVVPISLVCVSSGGAMGPEAPLVQTTGTIGTWIARRRNMSVEDVRILTITGMAAGFTVLFGAPLGAALFALEILHRRGLQYYEALIPALGGALAGYAVYVGITNEGLEPVWSLPAIGELRAVDLAWAGGAAVVGSALAVLFALLAQVTRRSFTKVPAVLRPVIGGAVLGLLAWWSPYALTFGEDQLNVISAGGLAVGALAVAALAKACGTLVTLSSGWKGGFIIPLFFIGATLGQLVHGVFPSANATVVMAALMVSLCAGVTKTPLGSTLVVTEMAGMVLLPTTILAAVISITATRSVALIETQRERSPLGPPPEGA
jgi:H+/Cl- antiporter ClcA